MNMGNVDIKKLSDEEVKNRGILEWPIWEKEISRFEWEYDSEEECLILDGEVTVETDEGNYNIKAGDFVTFQKGLKCVWDIKKPIRKHYNFK
ncbi:MAG: cupin domain-containing protein [Bacteroidales bacterium]|nr:cupin domain-containing protein [Bacteroidales bacterium]